MPSPRARKVSAGGKAESVLMPATVVDRRDARHALYREESFGPVVAVIRADDEADAIRLANDTEYGLSAAVFSRDTARGLRGRPADSLAAFATSTARPCTTSRRCPSAASKPPAMAASAASAGIDQFTELRWITIETSPATTRSEESRRSSWSVNRAPSAMTPSTEADTVASTVATASRG